MSNPFYGTILTNNVAKYPTQTDKYQNTATRERAQNNRLSFLAPHAASREAVVLCYYLDSVHCFSFLKNSSAFWMVSRSEAYVNVFTALLIGSHCISRTSSSCTVTSILLERAK